MYRPIGRVSGRTEFGCAQLPTLAAPEKDGNNGNHNGNGNANSAYRDTTPFKSDLLFFVEQNIGPVKRFGGKLTTALGKELQKDQ
jgi:hypothetical protein